MASINEGGIINVDTPVDTSSLLGPFSAQLNLGDGSSAPLNVVSAPSTGPLRARFDYTFDSTGFFAVPERRQILQAAADIVFSKFNDSLAPIVPSGNNSWTASFPLPATGAQVNVVGGSIAANEILIFVGARDLPGSTVALGGPGSSAWRGSTAWGANVIARGQVGGANIPTTDFGPWGGSMTVDPTVNWHFGTSTEGLDDNEYDFLTAVSHEFMHILGFGVAPSWNRLVNGAGFYGTASIAANGGEVPPLDGSGSHWREGLQNGGQETLMDPSLNRTGFRKLPTPLDMAALVDIGWNLIPQQARVVGAAAYADNGQFPLSITLTGSGAGSRSFPVDNITVSNVAPTLNPRGNTVARVDAILSLSDLGVFEDPGFGPTELFQYEIDWGDGSAVDQGTATIDVSGNVGLPTGGSFDGSHVYRTRGDFTVRYRVRDDDGGLAEQLFVVQVTDPPEIVISLDRNTITENEGNSAANLNIATRGLDYSQPNTIQLFNKDETETRVPATVILPPGVTQLTVPIDALDDTLLDGAQASQFFALVGELLSNAVSINVLDHEVLDLTVNVHEIRENAGPGAAVLTVRRSNTDWGSHLFFKLSSSDPSEVAVPSDEVLLQFGAGSIDVSVAAVDDALLDGTQVVTLTVSAPGYFPTSLSLGVKDYEPLLWNGPVAPLSEATPEAIATVTVTLPSPAPSGGTVIGLTSLPAGELQHPPQVLVPAGETSVAVPIQARDDDLAESLKSMVVIASSPGYVSANLSIDLFDNDSSVWTNGNNVFDSNGNGTVEAADIIVIINALRRLGSVNLPTTRDPLGPPFIDVNGNGVLELLDALLVINFLNRR